MESLNILGLETEFGYRTVELIHGDVTELDPPVDILAVSAFKGSYRPTPGTVIAALQKRHGIDAVALEQSPAIDLRSSLSVWLSQPLVSPPASRLLFVEIVGSHLPLSESLSNVFAALSLFEAKGISVSRVALPLLGTGSQQIEPAEASATLVKAAELFLRRSRDARTVQFVDLDRNRVSAIATSLDEVLGRVSTHLPREELSNALRQDLRARLLRADELFGAKASQLRDDWLHLLSLDRMRSIELGVHGRRLVEHILNRLGAPTGNLVERIRWVERNNLAAPWICGYMNVLRHLGNEGAHEVHNSDQRVPRCLGPQDLVAALICVDRLIEYWIERSTLGAV